VSSTGSVPKLNLALQGGGAHGAFTWGVLDGLLDTPAIKLGWISGTSAGAVNAVALASGLATGGPAGARKTLTDVWTAVVDAAVPDAVRYNPLLAAPWEMLLRTNSLTQMASIFSPYEFNPLGLDPLRRILEQHIDIAAIRAEPGPELLIAATDISHGRARLFRRAEISIDAVMASACLPTMHHAVEIEGRHYWDGGFSANPDLVTLASESPAGDTLIVQLSPLAKSGRPTSVADIAAHMNHLAFNRPYLEDLEWIEVLQRQQRGLGRVKALLKPADRETRIGRHRFHVIDAGRHTANLSNDSKGRPDEAMTMRLFHAGQSEALKWLDRHRADIGKRDTADFATRLKS
jgi:NTE family protein